MDIGAPSYTSGAHIWKGTIVILKKRPINTNKIPRINLILKIVKQNIPASTVFQSKLGIWYKRTL